MHGSGRGSNGEACGVVHVVWISVRLVEYPTYTHVGMCRHLCVCKFQAYQYCQLKSNRNLIFKNSLLSTNSGFNQAWRNARSD